MAHGPRRCAPRNTSIPAIFGGSSLEKKLIGASTLEIQTDKTGDTGVRHLRVKIDKKGSKFASLIDRLSGKK